MHSKDETIGLYDIVEDVLEYLHECHEYYMNNALVKIAETTERLIAPCSAAQRDAVWKFFTDYKFELENHFRQKEGETIPYVRKLMTGQRGIDHTIDSFCAHHHDDIDARLSDFKNIIMTSLPKECDSDLKRSLLRFLFDLQNDLDRHSKLEDEVLLPLVRMIEDPLFTEMRVSRRRAAPDDALSDREKEILVSVAQGLLNKEIADRHNISINTVITHRKNITRKTGIKTVAGLTVYAILNGLIDINSVQ